MVLKRIVFAQAKNLEIILLQDFKNKKFKQPLQK